MNKDKIKPLGSRVLIQRATATTSKGGILLPETAQEKPKEGVIIAAGPGSMDDQGNMQTLSVKVGDRVLFTSYAGTEIQCSDDSNEYIVMAEKDILGVITG